MRGGYTGMLSPFRIGNKGGVLSSTDRYSVPYRGKHTTDFRHNEGKG